MITENACCITKGWKYFKHWPAQGCLLSSCHRCTALSIEPVASKRLRGAKAQAVTYLQKWKLTWHWMDFFYLLIVRYLSYWIHTWYAETKYEGYCQYSVKKKNICDFISRMKHIHSSVHILSNVRNTISSLNMTEVTFRVGIWPCLSQWAAKSDMHLGFPMWGSLFSPLAEGSPSL